LLVVSAIVLAYLNSLSGPFIFDDVSSIPDNPTIRTLASIGKVMSPPADRTVSGRPVVNLTLALNYAIGGLEVSGYHIFNVVIHMLSALLLFGLTRRTLMHFPACCRSRNMADWLAAAVSLVWSVHPLVTESVTYIIQRTELLMGFFLLLTLYTYVRAASSNRPLRWHAASIVSCAAGMGCKEVMAVAPLLVLLYDRTFLTHSFRATFQQRWKVLAGLAATSFLLVPLLASAQRTFYSSPVSIPAPRLAEKSDLLALIQKKLDYRDLTPWRYLLTQTGIVTHYLRLSVWPYPLSIDYSDWRIALTPLDVFPEALLMSTLLVLTAWALLKRPWLGYLGCWFFLILSPTSSLIPLPTELAAERRMYLPLIAVIVIGALGAHHLIGKLRKQSTRTLMGGILLFGITAGFAGMSSSRNESYRSEVSIWSDVLDHRPDNSHACNNLGTALARSGRLNEALPLFSKAVALDPKYPDARSNLAATLYMKGRVREALVQAEEAVRLKPDYEEAQVNLALCLHNLSRIEEAIAHYREALKLKPSDAEAHNHLGVALLSEGRISEAVGEFQEALKLDPGYNEARANLHAARVRKGE
jgi:Flp pilus assembly protein TadD